jgi:hypothetical protein
MEALGAMARNGVSRAEPGDPPPTGCPERYNRQSHQDLGAPAQSKSTQPSHHSLLGLSVTHDASFLNRSLSARSPLKDRKPPLRLLVSLDAHPGAPSVRVGQTKGKTHGFGRQGFPQEPAPGYRPVPPERRGSGTGSRCVATCAAIGRVDEGRTKASYPGKAWKRASAPRHSCYRPYATSSE